MLFLCRDGIEVASTMDSKFARYYRNHHKDCVAARRAYYYAHRDQILARQKAERVRVRHWKDLEKEGEGDLKAWLRLRCDSTSLQA